MEREKVHGYREWRKEEKYVIMKDICIVIKKRERNMQKKRGRINKDKIKVIELRD